eukprot:scaffold11046_cov183-Amphora_coffeaeformis.AAC.21
MIACFHRADEPYAQRAWIALEECGVEYEKVMVDLQNKPQEFLDLYALANPLPGARAKVPLLEVVVEDEKPVYLTESLVLTEYIAEEHGRDKLLPPKATDRATMRLFTELCGSSFSYVPILRAGEGDENESAVQAYKEGLVKVDAFLKHYQSDPFVCGNQFSLAECNTAPFIQRACAILPAMAKVDTLAICDELGLAHLQRWIQAVLARPSVVDTGVSPDEMVQKARQLLERLTTMSK